MSASEASKAPRHQRGDSSQGDATEHADRPDHPDHASSSARPHERAQAVRFAPNVEEIGISSASPEQATVGFMRRDSSMQASDITPEQIRALADSLRNTDLQEQRMKSFSFHPVSLPASRIPSNETSPTATPQLTQTPMSSQSPRLSARGSDLASPPLTPAGTSVTESSSTTKPPKLMVAPGPEGGGGFDSQAITPQASGQDSRPDSRIGQPRRPVSSDNISQRTTAVEERDGRTSSHRKAMFSIGAGGQSLPASRESSPSRNTASQFYSRPFTPEAEANDPYAAHKRPPQTKNSANIDSRFIFSRKKKHSSPSSSSINLPKSDRPEKRLSGLLGPKNKSGDLHPSGSQVTLHGQQGSMSDLKRFFKVGGSHKSGSSKGGSSSASKSKPSYQVPFGDDHGLTSKYGKLGRVLGSGAGGSVKLMRRTEDNTVFAVKEFRARHSYETEKEYVKKLTAEFCIGSALHHGNIIETLDIVQEKGKWYEVMEYAPFDLFATVMTGKMSKSEIACCFLQILSGVTYLHSSGLAHRDLKLDNVVVSEHGIMKIIDFGSAHVFKYPFESEINLATGIVGSDPYLAPEVYDERKYDPQAVDIWSLAIIFCCMSLRRFPWKLPRMTDNSFKLFAAEPTPGHDPKKLILPSPSRSTNDLSSLPQRDIFSEEESKPPPSNKVDAASISTASDPPPGERKEVIRGPWRLLRLLPRESRHVIGRMLTIDPKKRAKMPEILDDPWVSDTVICRQIGPGQVVSADDHTHILEPPAPAK